MESVITASYDGDDVLHPPPSGNGVFEPFTRLPHELRLIIWELALPGPRIVRLELALLAARCQAAIKQRRQDAEARLHYRHEDEPYTEEELTELVEDISGDLSEVEPLVGFRSRCRSPALLFVCRESFEVASKFYKPCFHTQNSIPQTYFDYKCDVLYLDASSLGIHDETLLLFNWAFLLDLIGDSADFAPLEHLAVDDEFVSDAGDSETSGEIIREIVGLFKNLKRITIVVDTFMHETSLCLGWEDGWSQLAFLPSMDVPGALDILKHPEKHSQHDGTFLPPCFEGENESDYEEQELAVGRYTDTHGKLYQINFRILSTAIMKAKFETLKKSYEAETGSHCEYIGRQGMVPPP
ncbi:hypothetical protein B0O99DRAFT_691829 [Bisporella sp. PMI_857]|nr:hypothetical protein B0O99DRAFT_691829 [Bisporella sp. PMI_857]